MVLLLLTHQDNYVEANLHLNMLVARSSDGLLPSHRYFVVGYFFPGNTQD